MSGISEVEEFQDTEIIVVADEGNISIEGEGLRIDSFSSETKNIIISGKITGFFYYDKCLRTTGLFSRFKRKT
jgi:hypothetical protein